MTEVNPGTNTNISLEQITGLVNELSSLDNLSQEVSTRQQNVKNIKDGLQVQINVMDTTIKGVLTKVNNLNEEYQTMQNDFGNAIKDAKKSQQSEIDQILNNLTTISDFEGIRKNLQNLSTQTKELNNLLEKGDDDDSSPADLFNQAEAQAKAADATKAQAAAAAAKKAEEDAAAVAAAKAAEDAAKQKAEQDAADAAAAKQKADQDAADAAAAAKQRADQEAAAAAAKKAQEDKDAAAVGFKDVPDAKSLTPLETALDKLGMDEIKTAKDLLKLEGEALNKAKAAIKSLPAKEKSLITRAIENASPGGASNVSAIQNKTKFGLLGGKKRRKTYKKKKNSKKKKHGISFKKKKKSIRKK